LALLIEIVPEILIPGVIDELLYNRISRA